MALEDVSGDVQERRRTKTAAVESAAEPQLTNCFQNQDSGGLMKRKSLVVRQSSRMSD